MFQSTKVDATTAWLGDVCSVTSRKSIGMCANSVWFGEDGLDLVALADTKAAVSVPRYSRRCCPHEIASTDTRL